MAPLYLAASVHLLKLYISCLVDTLVWSCIVFLCLFAQKNLSAQQYNITADKITWAGFECFFCIGVEIPRRKKLIWVHSVQEALASSSLGRRNSAASKVPFLFLLSAAFDSNSIYSQRLFLSVHNIEFLLLGLCAACESSLFHTVLSMNQRPCCWVLNKLHMS